MDNVDFIVDVSELEGLISPHVEKKDFSDLYTSVMKLILKKADFTTKGKDLNDLFVEYEALKDQYNKLMLSAT